MSGPHMVILAGPNGAGKTTVSADLLRETLAVDDFVNADVIARGLSGFAADGVALTAGRLMLARLGELAARRRSFAFETTLASRSLAAWIRRRMTQDGYAAHLVFLWLPAAELAIARVAERVRHGGHSIAPDVVRRRYARGVVNFVRVFRPVVTTWRCYDASALPPRLIADASQGAPTRVLDSTTWSRIERQARDG